MPNVKTIGTPRTDTSIFAKLQRQIERKDAPSDIFDENDAKRLELWHETQDHTTLTDEQTDISVTVIPHPVSLEDLARLYHLDPTHYGCVALKAAAVGGSEWQLVTPKTATTNKNAKVPPYIQNFFARPNSKQSLSELIRNAEVDFQTTGNAYVEIVKTVTGKPAELHHVVSHSVFLIDKPATAATLDLPEDDIPDYCQFIRSKNETTKGKLSFYRAAGTTTPKEFLGEPVSEIIHLKEYSPVSEEYGLPSILAALNQLLIFRSSLHYRLNLFQNEGIGPTVFHYEGADTVPADDEHKLEQYIAQDIRQGAGQIIAIATESGVKLHIHRLSLIADMGADMIRELLTPMRDDILRVHRVPPRLVSVADTRGLGGSAEALAQMEQFQAMVIDARQQMWMENINEYVIRQGFASDTIVLKIKPISLRSLADMQKYYLGWLDRGVINIDDVREMALGLDPLPHNQGQVYRVFMGGQPLELNKPGPKPGETVPGIDSEHSQETP